MNDSSPRTERKHGGNQMAMACRHVVRALDTIHPTAVGFHWAPSDKKRYPDAWCTSCDQALTAAGGEWTPAMIERAGFGILCPSHHEFLKLATEPGVIVHSFKVP
jgi:hypothetical protein